MDIKEIVGLDLPDAIESLRGRFGKRAESAV